MKMLSSTKIAIGFVVICVGAWAGWNFYADHAVQEKFPNIEPGDVNIVGIETDSGFKIIVSNQAAQLVVGKNVNFSGESDTGAIPEGAEARRIPIKELLASLRGDTKALGQFVMVMNDRQENSETWPTTKIYWEAEDIKKAIAGDPVLSKKLVHDLNIQLDGTPLDKLSRSALENGIMVRSKVPVTVLVGDVKKTLYGEIETPYRPNLMRVTEARYNTKPEVTNAMVVGYYSEEAQNVLSGRIQKEDVRKSLTNLIDPKELAPLAVGPEKILRSAKVVVNDSMIEKADYSERAADRGPLYDINLHLNDEGRRRLWQYSRHRVGAQMLFIANGIAIAAPKIGTELAQPELQITQMRDLSLVRDAVDSINSKSKKTEK